MHLATKNYYFTPRSKKTFSRKTKEKQIFVQEWGNPEGTPVLFIHGFPGCSDQGQLMMNSQLGEKFRLIAIDRPGYGNSSRQDRLTPLSFARQLKTLLETLKIEQIRIISVSGGAPYALALAYILKERVLKASSIGGVAPLTSKNFRFLNRQQRKTWLMRQLIPGPILDVILSKILKSGLQKIEKLIFTEMDSFSKADQLVFKDPVIGPFLGKSLQMSLKQGPGGILDDMRVYSKNWGYNLKKVQCPVTLWHGAEDDVVHRRMAEDMSSYLPHSKLRIVAREGHYSLPMNYRDEIIRDILED